MSRTQHVLIVEDNDDDFETAMEAARRAGVINRLDRAVSGSACLEMLGASAQQPGPLPALVLLDLNMPSEDGRDALRLIRNDERLACVPLVVLSASANPRDVQFAYTNGVNAYHIKPVNHASHLGILQKIFDYWLVDILLPTQRSLKSS